MTSTWFDGYPDSSEHDVRNNDNIQKDKRITSPEESDMALADLAKLFRPDTDVDSSSETDSFTSELASSSDDDEDSTTLRRHQRLQPRHTLRQPRRYCT